MNVKFWSYNRFVWLLNHTVQLYTYMNTHAWTIHACIPTQSCTGHHIYSILHFTLLSSHHLSPFQLPPLSPPSIPFPFLCLSPPHLSFPSISSFLSCGWLSLCTIVHCVVWLWIMISGQWKCMTHILSCMCQSRLTTHTHALAHRHTFHRVLYMTSFIYHCMQLWSCRTYTYMYAH